MPQEPYYEVMNYWQAKAAASALNPMLVTNIGAAASGIVSNLLTLFAGQSLDTLNTQVPSYLTKNVGLATVFKTLATEDIDTIIENELARDYSNIIIAMKAGIGQGVGGIHASLYETLTGTNALLGSYKGILQRVAIDPYITRWANNAYTPNIPDAEMSWFLYRIGDLTAEQYNKFLRLDGWDSSLEPWLVHAYMRQPSIDVLLDMKRRGTISDADLKYMLRWFRFSDPAIENIAQLAIQYPEPYRLAEMHSKGLLTHDEYISTMGKFGIEYDFAAAWFSAQLQYPSFDQCLIMLRRGIIDENDFGLYMQMNQFGDFQSEQLKQLQWVIPPIGDLIRFAVREAYGDHDPEKQYSTMVANAKLMGLSEQASEWYWYSHWERIPINLMFANYHRGLWDKDKLEHMLKIVDLHPDDRQDVINVAYQPPSIRELGYGYDVGVYTKEDIAKYRRFGGLSPEDALKATEATIAYRTEAERNAVRTEYVYAYGRGALTDEELLANLIDIKTPEEAIPLWIQRAELYRERVMKPQLDVEGKLVSSSEALSAFKLKLRTEEWTREALKALDWTDERINTAIEHAIFDMAETEQKALEVKYRKLTLAQLKQMYILRIITKEQMVTEAVLIGYNPDDAELLTEIYTREEVVAAKPKVFTSAVASNMYALAIYDEDDLYDNFIAQDWDEPQAAMLTMYTLIMQEYPLLRTMYSKGAITGEQMVKELVKLEMPEFNATQLVQKTFRELQIDRVSHEKDLTKAEIIKGVKNNVLTPSQGAELLQDLGYDQNEAWYILAINKVVEASDPEGYWEMRRVTENYKKARGEKGLDIPDEMIMLEKQIKETKAELTAANKPNGDENKIAGLTIKLGTLEGQLKQLIIAKGLK